MGKFVSGWTISHLRSWIKVRQESWKASSSSEIWEIHFQLKNTNGSNCVSLHKNRKRHFKYFSKTFSLGASDFGDFQQQSKNQEIQDGGCIKIGNAIPASSWCWHPRKPFCTYNAPSQFLCHSFNTIIIMGGVRCPLWLSLYRWLLCSATSPQGGECAFVPILYSSHLLCGKTISHTLSAFAASPSL